MSSANHDRKKDDQATTNNTAYQDSLDSMTPQSQRTPVPTLTPVINLSQRKDQYDPKNVSHK